jgi:2-haloacid dehalogenase
MSSIAMPIPDVVVFDLGKVLLDFDYSIVARKVAARGTMIAEEIQRLIDHSPLLYRFETGELSNQQFFQEVCAATKYSGDLAQFSAEFADIFTPIEPMVELHAALKKRGVPTWIFSNTNELAVNHVRHSFPFFNTFTGYVLSYERGAMKPDPRIYEVVERETGRRGSQILYLDDRAENIETGRQRGWQTILQRSPLESRRIVTELGLLGNEPSTVPVA